MGGVSSAIMTMPPAGLYKGRKHLNAVNAGYENGRFTIKKYPGGKESNNKKRFSSVTGSSPLTSDKIEEEIKDIRENFIAPFYALVKKFRTWRDDGEKQGWLPNSSNGINGRSEGYKSLMNNLQIEKFYKDDHAKYEFGLIVESMESVMSGLGYNYSWRINDDGSIDAFQRREKPQTNKEWKESIEVWTKIIEYYIKEIEKFNKKAMKSRLLPDYEKDEVILDGVKVLHILREVVARRLSILKEAVGGASSALNNQQIAPEQVSPSLSAIDFSSVKVLDQMKESFSDAIIHLEGEIFGKHDIFMFGKELQRIDSAESKEILLNELIEIVRKLKGQHTSDKSKILIWDVIKDFRNIVSKVIDEPQDFINKLTRIQEEIESSSTSSSAIMPGGIDFRTMNYMVQPMGSFKDLRFMLPTLTSNALERIDLDKELESLRDMVKAGMVPSGMRVKEYLAACFQKGKIEEKQDDLLVCLAEIYRLAEEENLETSPELRESLVIVDTGKFVLLPNNQRVGLN